MGHRGARHFKKSRDVLCQGVRMKYQSIWQHQRDYRVARLCAALAVSRSGYYGWCRRPLSVRGARGLRLASRPAVSASADAGSGTGRASSGRRCALPGLRAAGIAWRGCGACMAWKPGGCAGSGSSSSIINSRPRPRISCNSASSRRPSTRSGSGISRRSRRAPAGCTSRCCWICAPAESSAGR